MAKLRNFFIKLKNFGFGVASAELKARLFRDNENVSYKRYEKIKRYLKSKYSDIIDKYAQLQYVPDETGGGI